MGNDTFREDIARKKPRKKNFPPCRSGLYTVSHEPAATARIKMERKEQDSIKCIQHSNGKGGVLGEML
jgi:hypothetical protein